VIISRQDEAGFPDFKSIDEAREYFMKRYGDKYNCGSSEPWEYEPEYYGGRMYWDDVDGQPVQISESGVVHVVY